LEEDFLKKTFQPRTSTGKNYKSWDNMESVIHKEEAAAIAIKSPPMSARPASTRQRDSTGSPQRTAFNLSSSGSDRRLMGSGGKRSSGHSSEGELLLEIMTERYQYQHVKTLEDLRMFPIKEDVMISPTKMNIGGATNANKQGQQHEVWGRSKSDRTMGQLRRKQRLSGSTEDRSLGNGEESSSSESDTDTDDTSSDSDSSEDTESEDDDSSDSDSEEVESESSSSEESSSSSDEDERGSDPGESSCVGDDEKDSDTTTDSSGSEDEAPKKRRQPVITRTPSLPNGKSEPSLSKRPSLSRLPLSKGLSDKSIGSDEKTKSLPASSKATPPSSDPSTPEVARREKGGSKLALSKSANHPNDEKVKDSTGSRKGSKVGKIPEDASGSRKGSRKGSKVPGIPGIGDNKGNEDSITGGSRRGSRAGKFPEESGSRKGSRKGSKVPAIIGIGDSKEDAEEQKRITKAHVLRLLQGNSSKENLKDSAERKSDGNKDELRAESGLRTVGKVPSDYHMGKKDAQAQSPATAQKKARSRPPKSDAKVTIVDHNSHKKVEVASAPLRSATASDKLKEKVKRKTPANETLAGHKGKEKIAAKKMKVDAAKDDKAKKKEKKVQEKEKKKEEKMRIKAKKEKAKEDARVKVQKGKEKEKRKKEKEKKEKEKRNRAVKRKVQSTKASPDTKRKLTRKVSVSDFVNSPFGKMRRAASFRDLRNKDKDRL
jgi:hypothetical protein